MKYHINKINREVELDDEIVALYTKMCELHDALFTLEMRCEYGKLPGRNISSEDLSFFCNRAMITELKAAMLIPKALTYIKDYPDILDDKNPRRVKLL